MATNVSGNVITQSGASASSRDTLDTITTAVNNTALLSKIAAGTFLLSANAILRLTGFTDLSRSCLIVMGNNNNLRFVGGDHVAGREIATGKYGDTFSVIYDRDVATGKQHDTSGAETGSLISGGAKVRHYGTSITEQTDSGYSGVNFVDDTADLVMKGLAIEMVPRSYVNIKIGSGAVLEFSKLIGTTIRDVSNVPFGLELWQRGEDGQDIVKIYSAGTLNGLTVGFAKASSVIHVFGSLTLRNAFLPISRIHPYGTGSSVTIQTDLKFKLSKDGTPMDTVFIYIANSQTGNMLHATAVANNSSLNIPTYAGTRSGTTDYGPPNTDITDNSSLKIGAVSYQTLPIVLDNYTDYLGAQTIELAAKGDALVVSTETAIAATPVAVSYALVNGVPLLKYSATTSQTITSQDAYDLAKFWFSANYKAQAVMPINRSGNTLDGTTSNVNVELDNVILNGNVTLNSTRTVTLTNNAQVLGGVIDAGGNSFLSFTGIDSWGVYPTAANRAAGNNALGTGTGSNTFRFNYAANTTYYLELTTAGEVIRKDVPAAIGETPITLDTAAQLAVLQALVSAGGASLDEASLHTALETYTGVNIARTNDITQKLSDTEARLVNAGVVSEAQS